MSNDVKKFFRFTGIATIVVLLIDFSLGLAIDYIYGSMKGGERARAHEVITSSASDLYIFGSSRALGHYDPKIFEERLGLSTYNAGRPAQSILYHLTVLKVILKRHTPKKVILDLNENELVADNSKYELMTSLLPYYRKEVEVRKAMNKVNPRFKIYSAFSVLPYNSSLVAILFRSIARDSDNGYHGFLPYIGSKTIGIKEENNCHDKIEIDSVLVDALKEFKSICEEKGIDLVAVVSPRYAKYKCERTDFELLRNQLTQIGIRYFDYSSNDKYLLHGDWMYDYAHLNETGAKEFSTEISDLIK